MLTSGKSKIAWVSLTILLVGCLYAYSFHNVHRYLNNRPSSDQAKALAVSPVLLEIVSGEFRGLMADYILLKGITFLGGRWETTDSDLDAIHTLFQQSLTLDPYFLQTCYLTQAYLAWGGVKVEQAIDLLKVSHVHRYWDWNPGFFIGFDYYYFLGDNITASKYLMETSKRPGAGSLIALLGARLSQKGGETETAIAFLKSMYPTIEDENTRKQVDKRLEALEDVLIIEKALAVFESQFNRPAKNLEELVSSGILENIPENPYEKPFTLEDGVIVF
jgi:hypothetical protein